MFTVLSVFALYLFLIGRGLAPSKSCGRPLAQAALSISVGILFNFCLMLTGQPMVRVLAVGALAGLFGAVRFFRDLRTARWRDEHRSIVIPACCVAGLLVVYYFEIFKEPLVHWDARAIWFFHAKMIWTDGALRRSTGLTHPSVAFSNPDYPELVPAIAAQLGYLKGYWNEFFPKGSLLVMFIPLALWVSSFARTRLSFLALILIFFFSLDGWLSNGYMDGYLALYSAAALLLLGRFLSERTEVDLYSGICALGIAANLKNEGLLFAVCAGLAFLAVDVAWSRPGQLVSRLRTSSMLPRILLLSVAPTIMWAVWRRAWGLQNDLTRNPAEGLVRFWGRLNDGSSAGYLFNYLTTEAAAVWWAVGLFAIAAIFTIYRGLKLHGGALVAATAAILYAAGLYVVYLSTPHNILTFYLSTSATRTMATASLALLVALFFLLSGLERDKDATESLH